MPFFDFVFCVGAAVDAFRVEAKHTFESVPFIFGLRTQFHGWLQKSTLAFIWVVASWIVASLAKLAMLHRAAGKQASSTHGTSL